jgi:hypothetical protein
MKNYCSHCGYPYTPCDECHNLNDIARVWPQRGGWYIKGYGWLAEMQRTIDYLRYVGFTLLGDRPVPKDAQVIYGPTGEYAALNNRRKRYRIGKWIRINHKMKGE